MLERVLFETAQSALAGAEVGQANLPAQSALILLVAVLVLQWDVVWILGGSNRGKAYRLLVAHVAPLALAAALVLGRRVVLVLLGV